MPGLIRPCKVLEPCFNACRLLTAGVFLCPFLNTFKPLYKAVFRPFVRGFFYYNFLQKRKGRGAYRFAISLAPGPVRFRLHGGPFYYNSIYRPEVSPLAYKNYNVNPIRKRVGDCTVRAIAAALGRSWDEVLVGLSLKAYELCDMPSANAVWGAYLRDKGFVRYIIPTDRVADYTVADFARDNPEGVFILAIDGHVVCVRDGDWYDSWDSGDEIPVYYWTKER